ncbi:hypothetical protein V2J09_004100 [Rumex salicifolius]
MLSVDRLISSLLRFAVRNSLFSRGEGNAFSALNEYLEISCLCLSSSACWVWTASLTVDASPTTIGAYHHDTARSKHPFKLHVPLLHFLDGGNHIANGSVDFSWTESSDDESENNNHVNSSAALTNHVEGNTSSICEASSSSGPSSSLFQHFVGMGFPDKMVAMALEENVDKNVESILETLLTHTALLNSPTRHQDAERTPRKNPDTETHLQTECDSDLLSSDENENFDEKFLDDFSDSDGDFEVKKVLLLPSERSQKLSFLEDMNFPKEEALIAVERCGPNASVEELADFILAAQMARADDPYYVDPPASKSKFDYKKRQMGCRMSSNKRQRGCDDDEPIRIPKPMIGFGVPSQPCVHTRRIPEAAIGPPYFYYENVALAPKGVWDTISRFLYDIEPEFVDSKYFCAAARKRGYIHNLPIGNRFPLLPLPPRTIHDALPLTRRWWPEWDTRTKLNCLQTCIGSAKLTERIRKKLENWPSVPPLDVQKYVLYECKKWNLVWVGRNKLAPLEPDEIELLLGFPKNHTRGVAYQLSVLKEIFPTGIKVLSLFSGIGGGEVALHRLGIPLKVVVSVEISEVNQEVVKSWWEQTNQQGTLIHIGDVQQLTSEKLEEYISRFDGFDFVIGGSPCNNLAGSNRVSRDGLEGKQSSLFFDYCRILDSVKGIMAARR